MKGEKIEVVEQEQPPEPQDNIRVKIAEAMRTESAAQQQEGLIPGMSFDKVKGGWDAHNGILAQSINKLDEDLQTSHMGESIQMLVESFGIHPDRPEIAIIISTVWFTKLKAEKYLFKGGKT